MICIHLSWEQHEMIRFQASCWHFHSSERSGGRRRNDRPSPVHSAHIHGQQDHDTHRHSWSRCPVEADRRWVVSGSSPSYSGEMLSTRRKWLQTFGRLWQSAVGCLRSIGPEVTQPTVCVLQKHTECSSRKPAFGSALLVPLDGLFRLQALCTTNVSTVPQTSHGHGIILYAIVKCCRAVYLCCLLATSKYTRTPER